MAFVSLVLTILAAIVLVPCASAQSAVTPEEWSRSLLQRCLEEREKDELSLAQLKVEAIARAKAAEDLVFPEKEEAGRAKALSNERKRYFARLSFFLMGEKARSLNPEAAKSTAGPDQLQRSLAVLFGDATACQLEALQATLLYAYFNVPFTTERLEAALRDEDILREVEHAFNDPAAGNATESYVRFDRVKSRQAQQYVTQLMLRLTQVASIEVAAMRAERSASGVANQSDLSRELQRVLAEPVKNRNEIEALLARMDTYIRRAAEPARIRAYVHARIDDLEEALRASIPDKQFDHLEREIERSLFQTEAALAALERQPIEHIVSRINLVIDRWFRREALPAIEEHLFENPFSAYWFFVQTGGLPRAPRPYAGSDLTLTNVGFSLDRMKTETAAAIVDRLHHERIPESYIEQHEALETELREVVLTRKEALDVIRNSNIPAKSRQRLETYLQDPNESDTVSSIDVYRWIIADSNRMAGDVDQNLVAAALELLRFAKQQRLDSYLARIQQEPPLADEARLIGYLRNAGAMLLELERRQAVERRFHQGTEAGFVGWLFGGFLFGSTVPIQLWAPGGVNGPEFTELLNEITPYTVKEATQIRLVHDGEEYRNAVIKIINDAQNFINVSGFDWKRDKGGRELTYRLMAKKVGISGPDFEAFVEKFETGLPVVPGGKIERFYDIPPPKMKALLLYHFFMTSEVNEIREVRDALQVLEVDFACTSINTCGDLSSVRRIAGQRYEVQNASNSQYAAAWSLFRKLQGLFEEKEPALARTKPRNSLADYVNDAEEVRRFVGRFGVRRKDNPVVPLPIHIIVDGKQSLLFNSTFGFSKDPPFIRDTPVNELYGPLTEFGAQFVLWKGVFEFPWHIGPIPVPGRKLFGFLPMPFVPYPWLSAVPGFGWAGAGWSLFLQFLSSTDPRNWWAMVTHVKHFSNEQEVLESGLGIGSKYNNAYPNFKTWHDMGVLAQGPIVDDANDYFVRIFNRARVNNSGNAGTKGVRVSRLDYEKYRSGAGQTGDASGLQNPSWFVTTDPERRDFNYRAVLLSALAAARKNIYLESSFFSDPIVPRMLIRKAREFQGRVNCTNLDRTACLEKRRDAVQIHVILPGASDKPVLDTVAAIEFHEMLHLGIKIYRWDPPGGWASSKMLHTKAWLVDFEPGRSGLAYVGSSNATQRSHILDEEAGIVSTSPDFVQEVYTRLFERDMNNDSRIESAENFHVTSSTNLAIRSGRWIRRFLSSLFFI
ncbi:MAG: hypothetical protein HY646_19770 [Acidobacteria bacterium]|nr:hypothetical protein [Acidobacteriota bacterium]